MARVEMQEFFNGKAFGDPEVFEGKDFKEVTEFVIRDLYETSSPEFAAEVLMQWFDGRPFIEKLGAFSIRLYDTKIGVWYDWTYTD